MRGRTLTGRRRVGLGLACLAAGALAAPATAGAEEPVTISRDSRGEPSIVAQTPQGGAYGFAYAQMQDQAPFILDSIAHAMGRSAELIGEDCTPIVSDDPENADPQQCFEQDQTSRLFEVPETARDRFNDLPEPDQGRLQAFADGINAYIATNPDNLPAWYTGDKAKPITAQQVLANAQYPFVMEQAGAVLGIIKASGGNAFGVAASASPGPTFAEAVPRYELPASNMFALASDRTKSKKPIVQGNPHLPFDAGFRWYNARLSYGSTRVQGATFRGGPAIGIGNNQDLAWSNTANHNTQNEQSAYKETLCATNAYLYDGPCKPMRVRTVTMYKDTGNGPKPEAVTFRYTVHGPVISDFAASTGGQPAPEGFVYSATVSEYRQVGLTSQLWRMDEATSTQRFKDAMAGKDMPKGFGPQLPGFNTIVADKDSNLFYVAGSRSGILSENPPLPGNSVLKGENSANDWKGILPFDELPHSDKTSGYLQNANNAPWWTDPAIKREDVPDYLQSTISKKGSGGDLARRVRQYQLLADIQNATMDDVKAIGKDLDQVIAPPLVRLLDGARKLPGLDPLVRDHLNEAATLIANWPGAERYRAEKDATAMALFAAYKLNLDNADGLGFNPSYPWSDDSTPEKGSPEERVFTKAQKAKAATTMNDAYVATKKRYGRLNVPWGNVHQFAWGTVPKQGIDGGDGDLPTLWLTECKDYDPDSPEADRFDRFSLGATPYYAPCLVGGGSSNIFNVDLTDNQVDSMRPRADTENPDSPDFSENAAAYVDGNYREIPWEAEPSDESSRTTLAYP